MGILGGTWEEQGFSALGPQTILWGHQSPTFLCWLGHLLQRKLISGEAEGESDQPLWSVPGDRSSGS